MAFNLAKNKDAEHQKNILMSFLPQAVPLLNPDEKINKNSDLITTILSETLIAIADSLILRDEN
jgi:hypothetical protein